MKRFNVWTLVEGSWTPLEYEHPDSEEKCDVWLVTSRSSLSKTIASLYKCGTYKIRLAA